MKKAHKIGFDGKRLLVFLDQHFPRTGDFDPAHLMMKSQDIEGGVTGHLSATRSTRRNNEDATSGCSPARARLERVRMQAGC